MKKIDLTEYQAEEKPYNVKNTMVALLFNPGLKLSARDLIAQDALAKKIEQSDGSIILEDAEYQKVKKSVEVITGWQRGDLEFVNRVLEANDVEVKEA